MKKDTLEFRTVGTLQDLTKLVGEDIKLYIAGEVKRYETAILNEHGTVIEHFEYTDYWMFMKPEKYTEAQIMAAVGDSYGDLDGCRNGKETYADKIISGFESSIRKFLYE